MTLRPVSGHIAEMLPLVLIVDDNEDDRYLTHRAIVRAELAKTVVELEHGVAALDLMADAERWRETVGDAPHVVALLDINMPMLSGFEVLEEIAKQRETSPEFAERLVVFIFSSSQNDTDRERAGQSDLVRGYLPKPLDVDSLRKFVTQLESMAI